MTEKRDDTNKPVFDDWTVNEPPTAKTVTAETTNDGWKMPEPVFRVSDGKLYGASKSETASNQPPAAVKTEQIAKDKVPGLEIQPQPFISEEFNINQIIKETPVKPKSGVPKVVFGIFGILMMALFALAFLVGVYFLFFYKTQK